MPSVLDSLVEAGISSASMATPQQYASTFDLTTDGQAVLAELMDLFGKAPFVAGKPDQTAYNCGAKAVIEHIAGRLAVVAPVPKR